MMSTDSQAQNQETATFGAGCFWGVQSTFDELPGVVKTEVGYSGGKTINPTYQEVCTDRTGHAEVVKIWFDPKKISYDKLLDVFFTNHNPTTLNRQGPDVGSQYRSAVFYHSDAQKSAAEKSIAKWNASGKFAKPIVTVVEAAKPFYRGEEYHQKYLEKRGLKHCHID
jgi:peptide-methionine (S)-S-oxide reductase